MKKVKRLTKIQRRVLFEKLVSSIHNHFCAIYHSSEVLPFAGSRNSPVRVVNTEITGEVKESLAENIERILRES